MMSPLVLHVGPTMTRAVAFAGLVVLLGGLIVGHLWQVSTWFKNLFPIPAPGGAGGAGGGSSRSAASSFAKRERELARWNCDPAPDECASRARQRCDEARALLREAQRLGTAEAERLGAALNHSGRIERLEARSGRGPRRTSRRSCTTSATSSRPCAKAASASTSHGGRPNPINGHREHLVSSNALSIEGRRRALVAALAAAEAMRLEPLEEATVFSRLTVLSADIPAVEPHYRPGADLLLPYERRQVEQEARS